MIEISKVVVHNLIKEQNSLEVNLDLSSQVYPINDRISELVERLNKVYNSNSILYGSFEEPNGVNFVSAFDSFVSDPNEDSFVQFSRTSLEILAGQISRVPFAKGGFFIYSHYSFQGKEYAAVYLIRDSEGILFNKVDGGYQIDDVTYIDLERLAMGCRINLLKFSNDEEKHISFTRRKQQSVSDYFINWISALEAKTNREYTNNLYNLMNSMNRPVGDNGNEITIDEFRERVYTYINSRDNHMVDLRLMGSHFYENPDAFTSMAFDSGLDLNTEFRADKTALNRFTRVEVVSDDMIFKFARSFYNSGKVSVSEDNEDLVIIESGKFARALLKKVREDD